jgi:hypothetical protein
MSGWQAWADSLAALYPSYVRSPGAWSMTTDAELCFLEAYARWSYTGAGSITDLGCWLGATTLSLARGLAASPHAGLDRPIEAYDRFTWEDWMTPIAAALGLPRAYQRGDDFFDMAAELLRPHESLVRFHRGDLLQAEPRRPIEFLFVDAMKSWPLADHIARAFFPRLIAGGSLVVQQDFAHTAAVSATNHLLMWRLSDHFECVYQVPYSCSVVFFCTRAVDAAALPTFAPELFAPEEIDLAWEHSLRCVGPEMAAGVRLCKIAHLAERGYDRAVNAAARDFVARGHLVAAHLLSDARDAIARRLEVVRPGGQDAGFLHEADIFLAHCAAPG